MNDDVRKLENLFLKLLNSKGIEKGVEIEENDLNFSIDVKISRNHSLNDIHSILVVFNQIGMMTKSQYSTEVELWFPNLSLYLDKR